jgi:hypothetical protein
MIAVTVARPTENAAIGLAPRRPTAGSNPYWLLDLMRTALRRGDQHGARLFSLRYMRALAHDLVGE